MSPPFISPPAGVPCGPRTPEPPNPCLPSASDEAYPPSPPRPRLRLKRRAVPHLSAPTQNFLASVAAADVPIPSIEEPEQDSSNSNTIPILFPFQSPRQQHWQLSPLSPQPLQNANLLSAHPRNNFSPPKTPAPSDMASVASPVSHYPNWSSIDSIFSSSAESSPDRECGSSRPSTARSTQTSSSSLFSRFSQLSDEEHCGSPEEDASNKLKFTDLASTLHSLRRNSASNNSGNNSGIDTTKSGNSRQRALRKVPWTKAMSSHLWATYILYLQDPKVTPFRVGKSCVPPHGVCVRVAREAKRSWKGAKALVKASANTTELSATTNTLSVPIVAGKSSAALLSKGNAQDGAQACDFSDPASDPVSDPVSKSKSGSSTPTAGESSASGTYMEWPHTNAATRAHLREMCRQKAATPGAGARGLQYMTRSPTPFGQAAATMCPRNLRTTPAPAFATQDMAVSLTLSTSEAMQPSGPLAQLTRSGSDTHSFNTVTIATVAPTPSMASDNGSIAATAQDLSGRLSTANEFEDSSSTERRRLGSPFTARSYGPSSSSSLAAVLGLSTANTRQPHTIGPRRTLQSPVRLSRPCTQKRRTKHLSQDLRRRPGLGTDFFTEPFTFSTQNGNSNAFAAEPELNMAIAGLTDELFVPRGDTVGSTLTSSSSAPELATAVSAEADVATIEDPFASDRLKAPPPLMHRRFAGLSDAAPLQPPARLGSPFMHNASFSFPNRFSHTVDFDVAPLDRPFATVHRVAQPKAVPARTNLASRLAYLDQRLREFNNRGEGY